VLVATTLLAGCEASSDDVVGTSEDQLFEGHTGLTLGHQEIEELFGASSPELEAAKLADLLQPRPYVDIPQAGRARFNEIQREAYERRHFQNWSFDTGEERIVHDPLFPQQLAEPLGRLQRIREPRNPRDYIAITAPTIEATPERREVRVPGGVLPELPSADLVPVIGEEAVAVLAQLQETDASAAIRYSTLAIAEGSSLFTVRFPTAVAKARPLYRVPDGKTVVGPEALDDVLWVGNGVRLTAKMSQRAIPLPLLRAPFDHRVVVWELEAPEGTIVVEDQERVSFDAYQMNAPIWDARVRARRVGPEGKLLIQNRKVANLPAEKALVRLLDPTGAHELRAFALPPLSRTIERLL
jgi:hypothetical protein